MANRLTKMRLKFVSLVDRGAGEEAQVVLAKRDTTCPNCGEEQIINGVCPLCGRIAKDDPGSTDVHTPVIMDGKGSKTGKSKVDPKRKKLLVDGVWVDPGSEDGQPTPYVKKTEVQKNTTGPDGDRTVPLVELATEESMSAQIEKGDFSELPDEAIEYIEKVEDRLVEAEAELAKAKTAMADAEDKKDGGDDEDTEDANGKKVTKMDDTIDPEDIFKNADPAVRAHFQKMQADLNEAQSIAKAERDARLDREFLAKAESLTGLAIPAAELGAVLKSIATETPEAYAKVEEVLAKASTAVNESGLFSEIGKRTGATQATGKVDQIAKSLQEKDGTLTSEQAIDKALLDNPALYTEYLAENGV